MSNAANVISSAMQDAIIHGPASGPTNLLALLGRIVEPFAALSDHDQGNELFEAFFRDLPFIQLTQQSNKPLSLAEHDRLVELLRWIIFEFQGWCAANDPQGRKLVALFVASQACDRDNELWDKIPVDIGNNADLVSKLNGLISSSAVVFSSRDPARTPIWECEAVEALKSAEALNDWTAIAEAWHPFAAQCFPNTVQTQTVRCLYRCGITCLADALVTLNQTAMGMMIASALSTTQRLAVAVASNNGYVQFCCLYQVLSDHRSPKLALSTEQEEFITKLLLKVADDEPRWAAWMKVFNAYPLRYPALQKSLGLALADAPNTAIAPYVNSIVLYPAVDPSDAGRTSVAACLKAFRSRASSVRRNDLWTAAHKRWSNWEFNQSGKSQHLFHVNWSELDYAIVGYASECLDSAGRNDAMNRLIEKLQELEYGWFETFTDIVTAWNRLLSLYQPYAYAEYAVTAGDDWLSLSKQCLPFDPNSRQYTVAKFRIC